MGWLSDLFMGKEKKFNDEKLGLLSTRVKRNKLKTSYTWLGEKILANQLKPTFFILEGDYDGPYLSHIKSLHRIIDTLDIITEQIKLSEVIHIIKQKYNDDWPNEFYLASIVPYDPSTKGESKQFEINFDSTNKDETDYISLLWNNDTISEIEANFKY